MCPVLGKPQESGQPNVCCIENHCKARDFQMLACLFFFVWERFLGCLPKGNQGNSDIHFGGPTPTCAVSFGILLTQPNEKYLQEKTSHPHLQPPAARIRLVVLTGKAMKEQCLAF